MYLNFFQGLEGGGGIGDSKRAGHEIRGKFRGKKFHNDIVIYSENKYSVVLTYIYFNTKGLDISTITSV